VGGFAKLLQRAGLKRDGAHERLSGESSNLCEIEFRIPNMVCEGCAEKIGGVLHAIPGVRDIWPNVRQKRIQVRYEPTKVDPERLKDRLAVAGFTAVDADRS